MKRFSRLLTADLLLLLLIVGMLPFLFFGGLEITGFRLQPKIWDIGHIFLFWAITTLVLRKDPKLISRLGGYLLPTFLLVIVAVSIPIELLQGLMQRSVSVTDIANNCIGGILAIVFSHRDKMTDKFNGRFYKIGSIILLTLSQLPLILHSSDWLRSLQEFPVMADFEHAAHAHRWDKGEIDTIGNTSRQRNHVLKVNFSTDKYSNLSFDRFNGDWQSYDSFSYRIYNPYEAVLPLTLRIHDGKHQFNNWVHSDRYNQRLTLQPGWNDFKIALDDLRNSPRGREMDLSNIDNVLFFTSKLNAAITLYFDDVKLLKEQ